MSALNTGSIIDALLAGPLPMVVYRMPSASSVNLVIQRSPDIRQVDILDMEEHSGFIIAPYLSAHTGMAYLIQPDILTELEAFGTDVLQNNPAFNGDAVDITNHHISHSNYINNTEYLIGLLKKEELHKVVFSRVKPVTLADSFSVGQFFQHLEQQYPEAFTYVFHLPGIGTWAGASPESLLENTGVEFRTMALAGTRKTTLEVQAGEWPEKEKEEQAMVSRYIAQLLSEIGITHYKAGELQTKQAGQLEHLLTTFMIEKEFMNGKTGRLIMGLHPTPAVCGLPKGDAFQLLKRAELHDRRFYTGFLGPWQMDNTSHLFVNLRCAELGQGTCNLYIGGGLTADSDPQREWEETELKSQTMLSVIEKMQKFAP